MKKILLTALATAMVCMASAQALHSNRSDKAVSAVKKPAMMTASKSVGTKTSAPLSSARIAKKDLNMGKKLTLTQHEAQSLKFSARPFAAPLRAGALQETYTGMGVDHATNQTLTWTMAQSVFENEEETPCLVNVIPVPSDAVFGEIENIPVPFRQEADKIIIDPYVIGSVTSDETGETLYIILFSGVDEEGKITLTLDENGKLTTINGDMFLYGAWTQEEYIYDADEENYVGYKGYFELVKNIKYLSAGEVPVPDSFYEPLSTYLHMGSSASGYSFAGCFTVLPPYASVDFKDVTSGYVDAWDWRMAKMKVNEAQTDYEEDVVTTATTQDFTLATVPGTYLPAQLTASFSGEAGEPFQWGHTQLSSNGVEISPYIYAGELSSTNLFDDMSEPMLTRSNTYDFGGYYDENFATSEMQGDRDFTIETLISYQGKPAAPLYVEGVSMAVYHMTKNDDFNLKCKIQKVTQSAGGSLTLGDVIAESEITFEDVEPGENLTILEWRDFYTEDEFGMTESLDYLFVEDEFAIVLEGWGNGSFQCHPLIDGYDGTDNSNANTYFFITGDETLDDDGLRHPYRFVGYNVHLETGIYGGYGYLHTDDNTDLTFGKAGGEAVMRVTPMLYSTDEETEAPTYRLFIDRITADGEDLEELPEWIQIGVANENYDEGIDYDLVITAQELAEGISSRTADIVFMQEGARLPVTIKQTADGTEVLAGDVNGDGAVNVADISAVIDVMAGTATNAAADVNGDGAVNVADISAIIDIMAGN